MHHPACTNRAVLVAAATLAVMASGTHASLTFTNSTTANGLGDNYVRGVYESGGTIYAATYGGGLSIANVTAVPGAGVAGLATIGLVGSRRRRR